MEQSLRQAAVRREFRRVGSLLTALCTATASHVRSLPPGDPQIPVLAGWLCERLDCTHILLRSARAALAEEYRRVPFLKTYLQQQSLSNG
jgi:hypothetical protein